MSSRLQRSILLVCLWTTATGSVLASTAQHGQTLDPRFVLEQLRQRLDAISNYQCIEITKGGKKHLAYDNQGRGRIRKTDENGNTSDLIWDGTRTIEVHERLRPDGTPIYSTSILPGKFLDTYYGNRPWYRLGGFLVNTLAKALEDGRKISIAPTENGHCRLEISLETGTLMAWLLDLQRGYLPVREELFVYGKLRRRVEVEFTEVDSGIWFPKGEFNDVTINDPDFNRLLAPDLPDGSMVANEVRGVRYVVDHRHGLTLTGRISAAPDTNAVAIETSESLYHLDPDQALKRVAPVSPADRRRFMNTGDTGQMPEAALYNAVYVFEYGDAGTPKVTYTGAGFLNLSEILHYVCGLEIAQYSGSEELLNLRLAGDWIVGRGASVANCLRALEPIVYEQTGVRINFEKQRVDAPVVRATGIFQYHPLPGTRRENDVQLFGERSVNEDRTYVGGGSGTLAQLLRHITNRTGRRFIDDTLSSEMNVSWSDYSSSELDPIGDVQQIYRFDLARLLEHVAMQTGLRFETERRTIDEWHLSIKP